MGTSPLTKQLADTKREWEACKKRMHELHK